MRETQTVSVKPLRSQEQCVFSINEEEGLSGKVHYCYEKSVPKVDISCLFFKPPGRVSVCVMCYARF